MSAALAKVLFIDDDANLLAAVQRTLRRDYELLTATGPEEGLRLMKESGPFAAAVCDMQMPGMDGLQVLAHCAKHFPDTTRIMMTGRTDQETAITAINRGHIFRFLCKPCGDADLRATLEAAVRQYRLQTAERELLEQTLAGSVRVLIDVLSLLDPSAYGRAARLREWAREMGSRVALRNGWEVEMAALLSPLGQVAVPPEILARLHAHAQPTRQEQEILARSPETARKLIGNIPRMQGIADIIYYQNKHYDGTGFPADATAGRQIPEGARLLRILMDLAQATNAARPTVADAKALARAPGNYDPDLLQKVTEWLEDNTKRVEEARRHVTVDELREGEILCKDIQTSDGKLVLVAGSCLSHTQIERLRNLARLSGLSQPLIEVEQPQQAVPAVPATQGARA